MNCEWPNCTEPATHELTVTTPDGSLRVWHTCRLKDTKHDNALKAQVTKERNLQPPPDDESDAPRTVECADCGTPLDEATAGHCPSCDSGRRLTKVDLMASTTPCGSIGVVAERAGGERASEYKQHPTLTRLTGTWGKLTRLIDYEGDRYSEEIVLSDGTTIVVNARYSDHPR